MRTRRPAALLLILLVVGGAARAATATDLVPPTIGGKPPAAAASTTATFSFSHADYAAFACSLDGADPEPCASPMTYEALAEGGHVFAVHGVDAVGVPGDPAAYAWTVDLTTPAAPSFTSPPARTGSTAEIAFTHGEPGLTFLCRLDGGADEPCTSPKTYSGLLQGPHVVEVRARDAAGNVGAAAIHGWAVDTTAPAVSLLSPPHGSSTNDSTPGISGTAGTAVGDAATVVVEVRQGAVTGGEPLRSATAPVNSATGAWGVTVAPALPEGAYNVRAAQSDDVGNTAASSRGFTVDLTPPAAPAVTGPAARTGSASAEIGFTHGETGVTFLCTLDGGSEEPCSSPKSYTDLLEGGHLASVRARDAAGNVGAAAGRAWTIDLTKPTLTLTSPAAGSSTNDSSPAVAGTAGTDPGDLTSVRVHIRQGTGGGGPPIRSLTAAVDPVTGAWSVAIEPALPEGTYNVKAEQSDDVGNSTELGPSVFTVDLTPPSAPALTGPEARTAATSAQIGITHGETGVTFLCRLDAGAEEPCTSPAAYTGLAEGGHVASVRARDPAGNVGGAASHSWTVDTTPPALALVSPAHGTFTNDSTPGISGTAGTAAGDVASVHVEVRQGGETGGEAFRSLTAAVNAGGAWSVPLVPALPEGTYNVRAGQSDNVGNSSVSARNTFTVDLSLPSVALTAPANGAVTRERTPRVSGTSDQGTVALDLFAGSPPAGGPLRSLDVPVVGGAWTVVLAPPLADGVYTSSARAKNAAGTTSTSNAVSFVVDDTPPAFTSVPEDLTLEQTARSGEDVAYTVAAEDALDPSPEIACSPPSGSTFPRGSTDVACTVTDWAGLSAEDGFTVTVSNTIVPAPVARFAARPGNRVVRLSWLRPTDWDYARVVVRRAARGKANWKVLLRSATATSIADRTVKNDREYVYRVTSVDLAGNVSPVATAPARPSALLAPAWGERVLAPPLLRWAKVKRARYYNVQVWYGGRKILSRWPAGNRYKVTATWKFGGRRHTLKPGLYIVHVWPGFGPKARAAYGPRIGWTKFVVP